ncbi:MAG: hypothetical protein HPM95_19960 [Alphaproteobacteria bacterium]|nr:hypothetical protein [Alphaproteobacteria bacterium]
MARKLMLDEINAGKMQVDEAITQLSREKRIDDLGWLAAQILQILETIAQGRSMRSPSTPPSFSAGRWG